MSRILKRGKCERIQFSFFLYVILARVFHSYLLNSFFALASLDPISESNLPESNIFKTNLVRSLCLAHFIHLISFYPVITEHNGAMKAAAELSYDEMSAGTHLKQFLAG